MHERERRGSPGSRIPLLLKSAQTVPLKVDGCQKPASVVVFTTPGKIGTVTAPVTGLGSLSPESFPMSAGEPE